MSLSRLTVFAAAAMLPTAVQAAQIDLSSYVNANVSTYTQGFNYPSGSTTIGGVAFQLSSFGGGTGVIQTSGDTFNITGLNVSGTHAYTIINSAFGTFGANNGSITFTGSGGASVTYQLVQGDNIRDHYYGGFNNTAANVFATAAYQNGGQVADGPGFAHFDVQKFSLAGLGGQSLASITLATNGNGGQPFLAAVTTGVAGVPEPANWALLIGGFALTGAAMRRRKARTAFA